MRTNIRENKAVSQVSLLKECRHPKIVKVAITGEKIIAFLSDRREISIPLDWLTDKQPVTKSQLVNYQIWDDYEVYWPDLKEIIGVETFTEGLLGACCEYH